MEMLRKVKSIHCNCAANNLYDKNILHAYVDVSCSEIMWTLLTVASNALWQFVNWCLTVAETHSSQPCQKGQRKGGSDHIGHN